MQCSRLDSEIQLCTCLEQFRVPQGAIFFRPIKTRRVQSFRVIGGSCCLKFVAALQLCQSDVANGQLPGNLVGGCCIWTLGAAADYPGGGFAGVRFGFEYNLLRMNACCVARAS
jgi:hypothetical protein